MGTPALVKAVTLAALLTVTTVNGWAADSACVPQVAQLVSVLGQVDTQLARNAVWRPAILQQGYCVEDRVRTGDLSRAVLAMAESAATRLSLNQKTLVNFIAVADRVVLSVDYGDVLVRSHTPRHFDVSTPFVNAGIEGTEFLVSSSSDQTEVTVFEGTVRLSNSKGSLSLTKGQTGVTQTGQPPRIKLLIKPHDAVQWALYYPPVIDTRALLRSAQDPSLRKAINLYEAGRVADAFSTLEQIPEPERTAPDVLAFLAGLLLTVGQVDQAESLIRQAIRSKPANGSAQSLLAMIALARNDKAQALSLANDAATAEPTSPIPLLARSYAEQAHFDLPQALKSVESALSLDPGNGLAHARHAELLASLGERTKARRAAERATLLNPKLGRAHTVLGFTELMEADSDAATQSFQTAIELDSFDPLAHFGLGLAKIRKGDLEPGTEDIEIAASLDPNDSLIRSYLGKAYYEQKRNSLADTQFELAKQYDPKDPTPHFYDAIKKQTENKPVEALQDFQNAVNLNSNRAVYRSQLLIDDDRAIRGTSLARIYDNLGFTNRGILEASKSVSLNPTDYSAHRFLSDMYIRQFQHQTSQLSELLQAQLMQSININPVQPHLSVSGLGSISGIGPAESAFKDFTTVFESNRAQLVTAGIAGTHQTHGDEAVISGVFNRASYSLGQYHYESDGFRKDSTIRHNIYNIFTQYQVDDGFNTQAELRYRETFQGDPTLQLDSSSSGNYQKNNLNDVMARIGARLSLSENSTLTTSFIYNNRRENGSSIEPETILENPLVTLRKRNSRSNREVIREGYSGDLQYIYRTHNLNLVSGGSAYSVSGDSQDGSTKTNDILRCESPAPEICSTLSGTKTKQSLFNDGFRGYNLHLYANLALPFGITTTLGGSYDSYSEISNNKLGYQSSNPRRTRTNVKPKVGLQWDISDNFTFRAYYGLTQQRYLTTKQTLEPATIAGFSQFWDDPNGSRTKIFSSALDMKFSSSILSGLQFSRRDIETLDRIPRRQDIYNAYLYFTPTVNSSIAIEYWLNRDDLQAFDLSSERLPIIFRIFDESGFFAQAGATLVWQEKAYTNQSQTSSNFAVFDAAVGYRLPNRKGIISIEGGNLLDKRFKYQEPWYNNVDKFNIIHSFEPSRTIVARITIAF